MIEDAQSASSLFPQKPRSMPNFFRIAVVPASRRSWHFHQKLGLVIRLGLQASCGFYLKWRQFLFLQAWLGSYLAYWRWSVRKWNIKEDGESKPTCHSFRLSFFIDNHSWSQWRIAKSGFLYYRAILSATEAFIINEHLVTVLFFT